MEASVIVGDTTGPYLIRLDPGRIYRVIWGPTHEVVYPGSEVNIVAIAIRDVLNQEYRKRKQRRREIKAGRREHGKDYYR